MAIYQERNQEMVELLSADFLRNRIPLAVAGSFSGVMDTEVTLPDGTAVTVLAGTVDALQVQVFVFEAIAGASDGDALVTSGVLLPGESTNLYDDDGADVVVLSVTAGNAVTVQRTVGSETYQILLRGRWLYDPAVTTAREFAWRPHPTRTGTGITRNIYAGYSLVVHSFTVDGALEITDDGGLTVV